MGHGGRSNTAGPDSRNARPITKPLPRRTRHVWSARPFAAHSGVTSTSWNPHGQGLKPNARPHTSEAGRTNAKAAGPEEGVVWRDCSEADTV